ncbi:D-amino acid aminotransferase [Neptunicella marina]|uniref:Aminodeoxychorismate lyase n=1 Tax=Neptunicella marina TaxID=2125989 RepID=A0A8J6IRQ3_9ALTE|nr:D-amino acid aminotransferase [Neptunicella marina]MBC3764388.1 D-amino acid aminotransferase [Neptunicella marina]
MSIAFLNGEFLPLSEARISPLDRGFLFGDGIYEVVPSYQGKLVGMVPHIERMQSGLASIGIKFDWSMDKWQTVIDQLLEQNGKGNLGVYIHVSRGADTKRFHAYPDNVEPTVFLFCYDIPSSPTADASKTKGLKVNTQQDLRWQRCNIKSTSLLGNVMHFQQGYANGYHESLLFNENNELTEASSCNAYIVKDGVVITPPLDNQILPGVTRKILLDILRKDGSITVEERVVNMHEVKNADEVWITSSSKDIAAVIEVDGQPVADGKIGPVWQKAMQLFSEQKFNY